MRTGTAFLVAIFASGPAIAESYLCSEEYSGGIKFKNGNWGGVKFVSNQNWVFTRLTDRPGRMFSITALGSKAPILYCDEDFNAAGNLYCGTAGTHYSTRLNRHTMRFLITYQVGYVNGIDESGDTPNISVGKCAELP